MRLRELRVAVPPMNSPAEQSNRDSARGSRVSGICPTLVFGIALTNSTASGSHHFGKCGARCARIASARARRIPRATRPTRAAARPIADAQCQRPPPRRRRDSHDRVLERDRADPLTARLDHVLRAIPNAMYPRASMLATSPVLNQPSVGEPVGRLRCVVVRGGDPWPSDLQLGHATVVPGRTPESSRTLTSTSGTGRPARDR